MYRSIEYSLILSLGNDCHRNFCYFFTVEVVFLQKCLLEEIQVVARGEADYMTGSSFFALTCLKLKYLLHTISLNNN